VGPIMFFFLISFSLFLPTSLRQPPIGANSPVVAHAHLAVRHRPPRGG
jgi:hypothetical protein